MTTPKKRFLKTLVTIRIIRFWGILYSNYNKEPPPKQCRKLFRPLYYKIARCKLHQNPTRKEEEEVNLSLADPLLLERPEDAS